MTTSITTPNEGAVVSSRPTIGGTCSHPNIRVELHQSQTGVLLGTGMAGDDGSWQITPDTDLPNGSYGFVANDGEGWSNNRYVEISG